MSPKIFGIFFAFAVRPVVRPGYLREVGGHLTVKQQKRTIRVHSVKKNKGHGPLLNKRNGPLVHLSGTSVGIKLVGFHRSNYW
jgi:hypothetical protein